MREAHAIPAKNPREEVSSARQRRRRIVTITLQARPPTAPRKSNRSVRVAQRPSEWPEQDRKLWNVAFAGSRLFDEAGMGAHLRPRTRLTLENGYGRWLAFLAEHTRRHSLRIRSSASRASGPQNSAVSSNRPMPEYRSGLHCAPSVDSSADGARRRLRLPAGHRKAARGDLVYPSETPSHEASARTLSFGLRLMREPSGDRKGRAREH